MKWIYWFHEKKYIHFLLTFSGLSTFLPGFLLVLLKEGETVLLKVY
jgi:hypothetical protein